MKKTQRFTSRLIVFITFILWITSCNPKTLPPDTKGQHPDNQTSPERNKNISPPNTAPQADSGNKNNLSQKTPNPDDNTSLISDTQNNPDEPAPTEPAPAPKTKPNAPTTTLKLVPDKLFGVYGFYLDVYQQTWSWRHWLQPDKAIKMHLVKNHRPNTDQILIEVISSQDPLVGRFCVVQSNFKLQPINSDSGNSYTIEALYSISNQGSIEDINNVQNIIEIYNTSNSLIFFTMEFYGDHGRESVTFRPGNKTKEGTPQDFDQLCVSCGFAIGHNGLCL